MPARSLLLAALAACSLDAHAQLSASEAWVRASLPQQHATGAFMRLTATGAKLTLRAASTPLAASTEIHRMAMDGEIARMQRVDALEIEAGQSLELAPGGYHLMLMGLREPLPAGAKVPLELRYELAGREATLRVEATVRPLNAGAGTKGHH